MILARKPVEGLTLRQDQFEALHYQLTHTRSTSHSVTVDKQALAALLLDHSKLIDRAERNPS